MRAERHGMNTGILNDMGEYRYVSLKIEDAR